MNDKAPINIAKVLTYGFGSCVLSMKDEKLNTKSFAAAKKAHKGFATFGVPVGYAVHNISDNPIEGIKCPHYTFTDGKYVGEDIEVVLKPDEFIKLPTKYVMLLCMQLGLGMDVGNGEFVKLNPDLETDDYDAKLSNFIFQPCEEFQKYFDNIESIEPVGYYVVRNRVLCGLEIIEDYYLDIFGNIENLRLLGPNNTAEKLAKVKLNSNSAKFLGTLC